MKKPHQSGELIRGSGNSTISQSGYNGNIPETAFNALEQETAGLIHGTATLTLHIRDGQLARFTTSHERSFVPNNQTSGGHHEY